MRLGLYLITYPPRAALLAETLASFAASDWGDEITVRVDPGYDPDPGRSQMINARETLRAGERAGLDWLVFCEDDIEVNRHLRHNLTAWLSTATFPVGTLYQASDVGELPCEDIGGSQGLVIRGDWLPVLLARWDGFHPTLLQDLRIYRSVKFTDHPFIPVHRPNLVQHREAPSTWGGRPHTSATFNPDWKAP